MSESASFQRAKKSGYAVRAAALSPLTAWPVPHQRTLARQSADLLKPHVTRVVVCDPRKTGLGKVRNRNDRNDARELAELLYRNKLEPVYHGEHGIRTLKDLARSYLAITRDVTRVMTRIKAIYRSWGIPCGGYQVYAPRHRAEWLAKLMEQGVHRRAEFEKYPQGGGHLGGARK